MPLYEYVCAECEERFERLVRSTSTKIEITCPSCGSDHVERAFSTFATSGASTTGSSHSAPACGPVG